MIQMSLKPDHSLVSHRKQERRAQSSGLQINGTNEKVEKLTQWTKTGNRSSQVNLIYIAQNRNSIPLRSELKCLNTYRWTLACVCVPQLVSWAHTYCKTWTVTLNLQIEIYFWSAINRDNSHTIQYTFYLTLTSSKKQTKTKMYSFLHPIILLTTKMRS